MKTLPTISDFLTRHGACSDGKNWALTQPDWPTLWANCENGQWLLWLLAKGEPDKKKSVRVACAIARMVLEFAPAGEFRPAKAIELAERWANGESVSKEDLARAARAGRVAAMAAWAAEAADSAEAAWAAAWAAGSAGAAKNKETADIVRSIFSYEDLKEVLTANQ